MPDKPVIEWSTDNESNCLIVERSTSREGYLLIAHKTTAITEPLARDGHYVDSDLHMLFIPIDKVPALIAALQEAVKDA
jgi:hypothetical protein